jgi:hypothetical protein
VQAPPKNQAKPYRPSEGTVLPVSPVEEIRRVNLLTLIAEAGSASKLSVITGIAASYISQTSRAVQHSTGKKPRTIGPDMARKFEVGMGKPRGWMDADHSALNIGTDLNGREGQLVGLFRLLSEADQVTHINELTDRLRNSPKPADDSAGPSLRH